MQIYYLTSQIKCAYIYTLHTYNICVYNIYVCIEGERERERETEFNAWIEPLILISR